VAFVHISLCFSISYAAAGTPAPLLSHTLWAKTLGCCHSCCCFGCHQLSSLLSTGQLADGCVSADFLSEKRGEVSGWKRGVKDVTVSDSKSKTSFSKVGNYQYKCSLGARHHWWGSPLWHHQTGTGILSHPTRPRPQPPWLVGPKQKQGRQNSNQHHCRQRGRLSEWRLWTFTHTHRLVDFMGVYMWVPKRHTINKVCNVL